MSDRVCPWSNVPAAGEHGYGPPDDQGSPRPATPELRDYQDLPEWTILDVLNLDCWGLILGHLDFKDVVRTERVSRGWQRVVLSYLQEIKRFNINVHEHGSSFRSWLTYDHIKLRSRDKYCEINFNCMEEYIVYMDDLIRKVGPWATHIAVDCVRAGDFENVVQNCPCLEHLEIFTQASIPLELAVNCKALRTVAFLHKHEELDDHYLGRLVANESIEILVLQNVNRLTGRFLSKLRSRHLKTLYISQSENLKLKEIILAVEHLKDLTRLGLINIEDDYSEVYSLLDNMPKLEYLSLSANNTIYTNRVPVVDDRLTNSIGRLGRLRYLNLRSNSRVSDALLSAVARGCTDLAFLDVSFCRGVSGRALAELCAARAPTLRELCAYETCNVAPKDVLNIIKCYHDIQDIDPAWLAGEIPYKVRTDRLHLTWLGSDQYHRLIAFRI